MSVALKTALELGFRVGLTGLLALGGCRSHAAAQAQDPKPGSSAHAPWPAPPSDPELAAAERSAIATLNEFRAALERADTSAQHFEIEAIVTGGALSERLWLGDVRPVADGFEGSVEAPPQVVKSACSGGKRCTSRSRPWSIGATKTEANRGAAKLDASLHDASAKPVARRRAHALRRTAFQPDGCAALGERYASGTIGEVRLDRRGSAVQRGVCAGVVARTAATPPAGRAFTVAARPKISPQPPVFCARLRHR